MRAAPSTRRTRREHYVRYSIDRVNTDLTPTNVMQVSLEGTIASSGVSYVIPRLVDSLVGQSCNSHCTGLSWSHLRQVEASASGDFALFAPVRGFSRLGVSPDMRRWIDQTAKCVDLIHFHSIWMMPGIYASRAARRHRIPLVVSPHGTLNGWSFRSGSTMKPYFWRLLQRPALLSAACFHATADSEYEDIRRHGFSQPIAVIPFGVDISPAHPRPERAIRRLLFLSRIHPVKGVSDLLHAWVAVQERFPDWQLEIAGPDCGGHLGKMKSLAVELRANRVEFTGEHLGANKWARLAEAALFVLPTYSENFGVVVAEALAAGVPAIVSKGAPWRQIESRRAGWWPDIGVSSLATCLSEALSRSPNDLRTMGANGRQWMHECFSWPEIGRNMAAVYRWLVARGDRPDCVRLD